MRPLPLRNCHSGVSTSTRSALSLGVVAVCVWNYGKRMAEQILYRSFSHIFLPYHSSNPTFQVNFVTTLCSLSLSISNKFLFSTNLKPSSYRIMVSGLLNILTFILSVFCCWVYFSKICVVLLTSGCSKLVRLSEFAHICHG